MRPVFLSLHQRKPKVLIKNRKEAGDTAEKNVMTKNKLGNIWVKKELSLNY